MTLDSGNCLLFPSDAVNNPINYGPPAGQTAFAYNVGDYKRSIEKVRRTAEEMCIRDSGFTSNSKEDYEFAMWRAKRSIDIANAMGAKNIVLWLAREGTLCACLLYTSCVYP